MFPVETPPLFNFFIYHAFVIMYKLHWHWGVPSKSPCSILGNCKVVSSWYTYSMASHFKSRRWHTYGAKGETIVESISIGDNVAIPCDNDVGKVLWLLFCDKAKHIVKDNFVDSYGNTYYEGDEVIQNYYYDLLHPRNKTYFFNDDVEPAYIYSHLMCASKFGIPPTSHNVD